MKSYFSSDLTGGYLMRNFLPVVLFLGVVLSCSDDDRNPTASEPLRAAGDGAAGAAKAAAYEVPQSLIDQVVNYYDANKHKPGGGKNWLRVLLAFDVKPIGMQACSTAATSQT